MDRRELIRGAAFAGGAVAAAGLSACGEHKPSALRIPSASRRAWDELLQSLEEIDRVFLAPEEKIFLPDDIAEGHRFTLHALQWALNTQLDVNYDRPTFQRIVSPFRKLLGDNPDAIYYEAWLRPGRNYRIRSNMAGAVYTSFTVESGDLDGGQSQGVVATINSDEFDVAADGSFEITAGPAPATRNHLHLPSNSQRIITRHYYELPKPVAADTSLQLPFVIEPLDNTPVPPRADDDAVALGIARIIRSLRDATIDGPLASANAGPQPNWVSREFNVFRQPAKPSGDIGFAAKDNAYAMAPFLLGDDEALIIRGRMPPCRFASVMLWNRYLQTLDYVNRSVSLNRSQLQMDAEGRFVIVVAHQDPGVANWLDTEGRGFAMMYWRFLLPEGPIETPQTEVVPFAELRARLSA